MKLAKQKSERFYVLWQKVKADAEEEVRLHSWSALRNARAANQPALATKDTSE